MAVNNIIQTDSCFRTVIIIFVKSKMLIFSPQKTMKISIFFTIYSAICLCLASNAYEVDSQLVLHYTLKMGKRVQDQNLKVNLILTFVS